MALLMSLILGSGLAAFTSNLASAQNYVYQNGYSDNNSYSESSYGDSSYSKYLTEDKKYECRTGPFEGFFISSEEFCDNKKFDDKRDHKDRDNKTGQQVDQVHKVNGSWRSRSSSVVCYTVIGPEVDSDSSGDK